MQYSTRAASHVTSKNRRKKLIRKIVLANESTMLTEVLKYSSNLLLIVVVSWCMTYDKNKSYYFISQEYKVRENSHFLFTISCVAKQTGDENKENHQLGPGYYPLDVPRNSQN